MEPILYSATTGGRANFKRQEVTANNLANINTPGFKADLYRAQTMFMTQGSGEQIPGGQGFIKQIESGIDLTPGGIMTTGRELDVAIDGDGWLAVKDINGKEGYVRGGSLRLDVNGRLITASGLPVLGDGGPISIPPARSIEIASDGTISILPLDGDSKSLAILDRLKLVKLDKNNIAKNERGLVQLKVGNQTKSDATVKVLKGALEGSNVQAIEQMVGMISSGREFDSHMKILSTVDDNAQKLAQVLQV